MAPTSRCRDRAFLAALVTALAAGCAPSPPDDAVQSTSQPVLYPLPCPDPYATQGDGSSLDSILPPPEDCYLSYPTRLSWVGVPPAMDVGSCAGPLAIQVVDSYGRPVSVLQNIHVGLTTSHGSTGAFRSGSCSGAVTSSVTVLLATWQSPSFYYVDSGAGVANLTAAETTSSGGLLPSTRSVEVGGNPPTSLAFVTSPQTVVAGSCSGAVSVELKDETGQPKYVSAPLEIDLSSGASTTAFFSDVECTQRLAGSTSVPENTSQGTFYFADSRAGTPTLTASFPGGPAASQQQTVLPGPPSRLAFASPEPVLVEGECSSPIKLVVTDELGNRATVDAATAVALSVTLADVQLFADAACSEPVTEVTIPSGGSSAEFYLQGLTPGAGELLASANSLAGRQAFSIVVDIPQGVLSLALALEFPMGRIPGAPVTVHCQVSNAGDFTADGLRLGLAAPGLTLSPAAGTSGAPKFDGAQALPAVLPGLDGVAKLTLQGHVTGSAGLNAEVAGAVFGPTGRVLAQQSEPFGVDPLQIHAGCTHAAAGTPLVVGLFLLALLLPRPARVTARRRRR